MDQHLDESLSEEPLKHALIEENFQKIFQDHPELSFEEAFMFEYCKLYIDTVRKENQIEDTIREIQQLKGLVSKEPCRVVKRVLSQQQNSDNSNEDRLKRVRRTANQIARHYVCRVEKCQKSYGSQGSLNQHMKLKHPHLVEYSDEM